MFPENKVELACNRIFVLQNSNIRLFQNNIKLTLYKHNVTTKFDIQKVATGSVNTGEVKSIKV